MASAQIQRDDEARRVVALVLARRAFDAFRASGFFFGYRDTFLDEDRIEAYKVLVIRGRWRGSQATWESGDPGPG